MFQAKYTLCSNIICSYFILTFIFYLNLPLNNTYRHKLQAFCNIRKSRYCIASTWGSFISKCILKWLYLRLLIFYYLARAYLSNWKLSIERKFQGFWKKNFSLFNVSIFKFRREIQMHRIRFLYGNTYCKVWICYFNILQFR